MDTRVDPAEVFMHDMISEFEIRFNRFLKSDDLTLELSGQNHKCAYIVYREFKKVYGIPEGTTVFQFRIDPQDFSSMDRLLALILQKSPYLTCTTEYIKAPEVAFIEDSIKPPPISQLKLVFKRD